MSEEELQVTGLDDISADCCVVETALTGDEGTPWVVVFIEDGRTFDVLKADRTDPH